MYSNRRREHIHIIRQYEMESGYYTGTRLVIFNKDNLKYIRDYDNFIKHRYKNPKTKAHNKSVWRITNSTIPKVIKKQMVNTDEEEKFKMTHVLYDSQEVSMIKYYMEVLREEEIPIDINIFWFIS